MYFVAVILLLLVLPLTCIAIDAVRAPHALSLLFLAGKWFVFWAGGVRLFTAGVRQVLQPRFTALEIFDIRDPASFPLVRELGFANLAMGALGIYSVFQAGWILPAALVGGLYYGLAGLGHSFRANKNVKEYVAMISDGFIFVVLLAVVINGLM